MGLFFFTASLDHINVKEHNLWIHPYIFNMQPMSQLNDLSFFRCPCQFIIAIDDYQIKCDCKLRWPLLLLLLPQ